MAYDSGKTPIKARLRPTQKARPSLGQSMGQGGTMHYACPDDLGKAMGQGPKQSHFTPQSLGSAMGQGGGTSKKGGLIKKRNANRLSGGYGKVK